MPEHFLKIRETYFDPRTNKTVMIEAITVVNLDKILTITYSKIKEIEGDYVRITFENSSIVGMVVN